MLDRKRRLEQQRAADGRANGLVEISGPLSPELEAEIRALAESVLTRERARDPAAAILAITPFEEGLAIETESEKLAQHIADAVGRSRHAEIERAYDEEGGRRILTCRLPGRG